MTLQFSAGITTLGDIETEIGPSAVLKIREGSQPAQCADPDSGTVLATIQLAPDWGADVVGNSKSLNDLPVIDASADDTGTAGHFRLYASDGTTCHCQGSVGTVGTDLVLDTADFVAGDVLTINTWTWNDEQDDGDDELALISSGDFSDDMYVDIAIPASGNFFELRMGGLFVSDNPTSGFTVGVLMSTNSGVTFSASYKSTFLNGFGHDTTPSATAVEFDDDLGYLCDGVKELSAKLPVAILADIYPGGVGVAPNILSRGNANGPVDPTDSSLTGREHELIDILPLVSAAGAFATGRINLIRLVTWGYFNDPQDGAITNGWYTLRG